MINLTEIQKGIDIVKSKLDYYQNKVVKTKDIENTYLEYQTFVIKTFNLDTQEIGFVYFDSGYNWIFQAYEFSFEKSYKFGCKDNGYSCMDCHSGHVDLFNDILKEIVKSLLSEFNNQFNSSF